MLEPVGGPDSRVILHVYIHAFIGFRLWPILHEEVL